MGRQPTVSDHRRKERVYVEVILDTSPKGDVTPLAVVWETGERFRINRVLERRPARSLRTGGDGMRYTVRIGSRQTFLWYDGERWFVVPRKNG